MSGSIAILLCFDSESVNPPTISNEFWGCMLANARESNGKSTFLNSFGGICSTVLHLSTSSLEIWSSRIWYRAYAFSIYIFSAHMFLCERGCIFWRGVPLKGAGDNKETRAHADRVLFAQLLVPASFYEDLGTISLHLFKCAVPCCATRFGDYWFRAMLYHNPLCLRVRACHGYPDILVFTGAKGL